MEAVDNGHLYFQVCRQIIQDRVTSFKNGIPRNTWMTWFKHRHLENLEELYTKYGYDINEIWNLDKSSA